MPHRILRLKFTLSGLVTLFLLALVCAVPAHAADTTVIGTDTPTQDVPNVQAAVDKGGSVLLKGHFNFGTDGRIKITKNIRISGEIDEIGDPKTLISGGFWTLYAPLPYPDAPPAETGPIVAIRAIRFDRAKGSPLHFPHVSGLDIRDCVVTNVLPQQIDIERSERDTLPFQAGVVVGNRIVFTKGPLKKAVTGTIRIEDNRFFMEDTHPDTTAGFGVLANWTTGAAITIRNNTILHTSRNAIEVLDNVRDIKGNGSISIAENRIVTAEEGIPYPHKYTPNGIVAGWYFDTRGGTDFSRNSRIAITGNRIEGRGNASTGILLYANDTVVTCNDIVLAGGDRSRGIVQTGSRGFFANNRVRGEGRYAIYCYPFESLKATANTFAWTDLNDFTGIKGHILLGGQVNLVIGTAPFLLDKGRGNRVVETPPCALPEIDPENESWTSTE
ncbi:right-handed parallel beta-helix repeat-containing protein [Pseudodesulfovibrio sp. JC047]|uniref:right-handed parallel beta-helix repeat-containing protein n=1 Tax=Pseudodesulfovibrio sp. JC047 TaxID=2683199 RepID=UPI0013D15733|nr:right-handed parallel beta-helix repeat-containing protein [Pseudodesulfovibrio sp. JC047]NDV20333.1 right-handed parallel beta-helix repeat-containing protein [Pseudodesulfovibrio sp. JC047]